MSGSGSKHPRSPDGSASSRRMRVQPGRNCSASSGAAAAEPPAPAAVAAAAAASAATPAPVFRLYAAVLGEVFSFADLPQLTALLAVCRQWQQAGRTMPPLQLTCGMLRSLALLQPPRAPLLSRHVAELTGITCGRSDLLLCTIAERLPRLTALSGTIRLQPGDEQHAPPRFPAALRRLRLHLWLAWGVVSDSMAPYSAYCGALFANLAQLQHLEELHISQYHGKLDLAPLLEALPQLPGMQSLRKLDLSALDAVDAVYSETQLQSLRSLQQLLELKVSYAVPLHRLLADGHQLQRLQHFTTLAHATQQDVDALVGLPMLRALRIEYVASSNLNFLAELPHLSSLELWWLRGSPPLGAAGALEALRTCTRLTELKLRLQEDACQLSDAQLGVLLPCMPLLRHLKIHGADSIKSLSFLCGAALATNLLKLDLHIAYRKLPGAELAHVAALQALQTLHLSHVFNNVPAGAALYQPPSQLFPLMRETTITC